MQIALDASEGGNGTAAEGDESVQSVNAGDVEEGAEDKLKSPTAKRKWQSSEVSAAVLFYVCKNRCWYRLPDVSASFVVEVKIIG